MVTILGYAISDNYLPILKTIGLVLLFLIIFNIIVNVIKKTLLKKAKSKKQISNIIVFSKIIRYALNFLVLLIAIFSYSGAWDSFGITIGLISAALGWALQKPITGIAGWMMVVIKRPFSIGDRIIIGGIRGDVIDITLTHIHIAEIGGIVAGEENSGRITLVPNSILFEQNIINYTSQEDYILDQVTVTITHQSNLDKAIEICKNSARKITADIIDFTGKEPYIRTYMNPSGINIHIRYLSFAKRLEEISSNVSKEIYTEFRKEKDIEFAYQHLKVFIKNIESNIDQQNRSKKTKENKNV